MKEAEAVELLLLEFGILTIALLTPKSMEPSNKEYSIESSKEGAPKNIPMTERNDTNNKSHPMALVRGIDVVGPPLIEAIIAKSIV